MVTSYIKLSQCIQGIRLQLFNVIGEWDTIRCSKWSVRESSL